MDEWIAGKYIKYYLGRKDLRVHVEALHDCQPKKEEYEDCYDEMTGEIADNIRRNISCGAIIALKPRTKVNLHRLEDCTVDSLSGAELDREEQARAVKEYRKVIANILRHLKIVRGSTITKPYLHLSIHGFDKPLDPKCWSNDLDFEIGTSNSEACNNEISLWFLGNLNDKLLNQGHHCKIWRNKKWRGTKTSLASHRMGSPVSRSRYRGYGIKYNAIQLEISAKWRQNFELRKLLIKVLSGILVEFNDLNFGKNK